MSGRARILPLAAAVEECIRDGDSVAMEGFTHLIPFAAGHELIRQRRKRLTLYRMTPDLIYDQLIGMGGIEQLVFSWGGNPGACAMRWRTVGRLLWRWLSTRMRRWRMLTMPALQTYRSRCCAATLAPISRA